MSDNITIDFKLCFCHCIHYHARAGWNGSDM